MVDTWTMILLDNTCINNILNVIARAVNVRRYGENLWSAL